MFLFEALDEFVGANARPKNRANHQAPHKGQNKILNGGYFVVCKDGPRSRRHSVGWHGQRCDVIHVQASELDSLCPAIIPRSCRLPSLVPMVLRGNTDSRIQFVQTVNLVSWGPYGFPRRSVGTSERICPHYNCGKPSYLKSHISTFLGSVIVLSLSIK